jgi:hypothetical protein
VDPNAAALEVFKKAADARAAAAGTPAVDPKAPAPSASSSGGAEAGKAVSAPGTAEPAAGDVPTIEALKAQQQQLSRGFAKLAGAKAEIQAQQERIKAAQHWEDGHAKVKQSPSAVLELHGITLEDVAADYLKRNGAGSEPTVEDRIAQLEAERKAAADRAAKDAETQQTQAQQEARATGVAAIQGHLQVAADRFPVTLAKGEAEHVFDAVMRYGEKYQLDFSKLTPEATTELVTAVATAYEDARQAQVDEEVSALVTKVPKLAARFAPPKPNGQTAPAGGTNQGAQASSVTLVGNGNEAPPPQPVGRLSKAELERRALEHFKPRGAPA